MQQKLNIFYEEPDPDRWFPYDRYLRKIIRRIVRGTARPGGVMRVALGLMEGLDKLGIPYRFNDYSYARKHPNELIGVIGKPHLIFEKKFKNPILFGAGVFSHPIECPDLLTKYPNVKKILVPGEWMRKMFEPFYGNKVEAWPVGTDTNKWAPSIKKESSYDFLIYDKIRWDQDIEGEELVNPILKYLTEQKLTYVSVKYGQYTHEELIAKLAICKAAVFFCEHETQGLAYQQILATGTPILAWDKGEYWTDPFYYPNKVKFKPVSSVPYWDERCGTKFTSIADFPVALKEFIQKLNIGYFKPRDYIMENLTLEDCAKKYAAIYHSTLTD